MEIKSFASVPADVNSLLFYWCQLPRAMLRDGEHTLRGHHRAGSQLTHTATQGTWHCPYLVFIAKHGQILRTVKSQDPEGQRLLQCWMFAAAALELGRETKLEELDNGT